MQQKIQHRAQEHLPHLILLSELLTHFLPIICAIFCLCDHYTLCWRLLIGCWSWDVKRHFGLDSQLANVVDGGGHNVSQLQIDDDDVIINDK